MTTSHQRGRLPGPTTARLDAARCSAGRPTVTQPGRCATVLRAFDAGHGVAAHAAVTPPSFSCCQGGPPLEHGSPKEASRLAARRMPGRRHGSKDDGAECRLGRGQRFRQDHFAREHAVRVRAVGARQRGRRHHRGRCQRRVTGPADEHRDQRCRLRGPWPRLHHSRLSGIGRVRPGCLQRRTRLRRRAGGRRTRPGAPDQRGAVAPLPRRARDSASDLRQQDGSLGGPLPRPAANAARPEHPASRAAPVRDRPRR